MRTAANPGPRPPLVGRRTGSLRPSAPPTPPQSEILAARVEVLMREQGVEPAPWQRKVLEALFSSPLAPRSF
jgi:hypothetical protein